jgi:hypothetical protein
MKAENLYREFDHVIEGPGADFLGAFPVGVRG